MEKKHLTIMFTDIKGFTDRTSKSSRHELKKLLELHDELICPFFNEFGGTIVKTIGDAFLVTFHSPTDAVLCGMKIQKELAKYNEKEDQENLEIRIAINSGEVLEKNNDIFGEPVNIAARLESIAEPGDIYFTEAVYLAMNKAEIPTAEVGYRHFKGIPEEVKVYKVLGDNIQKKGVFSKKEKEVIRHPKKKKSQERFKTIFMWIGIIAVALLILGVVGLPLVILFLVIAAIIRFLWKSKMNKIFKWIIVIVLALFLIGMIGNTAQQQAQEDQTNLPDQGVINRVNQLKASTEQAIRDGNDRLALENINKIKDISKDFDNPAQLQKLIGNLEKAINN